MVTTSYIVGSNSRRTGDAEAQRRACTSLAGKLGLKIAHVYFDPAASESLPMHAREAGRRLIVDLRAKDVLIIARYDRLGATLGEFAENLNGLLLKGVIVQICDLPFGVFDPRDPSSLKVTRVLLGLLARERERRSTAISAGMTKVRSRGGRFTRHAPYGWRWERTGYDRKKKKAVYSLAPNENERIIARQALLLHQQGLSFDAIRQNFNYEWKVLNRVGGEWTCDRIRSLVLAAEALAAEELAASVTPGESPNRAVPQDSLRGPEST